MSDRDELARQIEHWIWEFTARDQDYTDSELAQYIVSKFSEVVHIKDLQAGEEDTAGWPVKLVGSKSFLIELNNYETKTYGPQND